MADDQFGYVAGGDISPARFVKQSTVAGNTILAAGAGDSPIGIISKYTHRAPYTGLDDGLAASAGESGAFKLHLQGEVCDLELGGTVTAGDYLKPTTGGKGITASADGDVYGAKALRSGVLGDLIQVTVKIGFRGA